MNAREIADRLDGMRIENVEIQSAAGTENWMAIHQPNAYELPDVISLHSEALLAFCRAVVEKIDGPTFTIEQIDNYVYNNTFCATPYEYSRVWNDALEDTRNRLKDPKDGIAALVKRDKEMA